ncbi:hypothetical protein OG218_03615 [Kineococcus sp. NBC_00420]|uniref:hypothetical protein n=1 Tax=Kineococcus sp. NBC_00420 TaxID=2903564 RepID=UPI002E1D950A
MATTVLDEVTWSVDDRGPERSIWRIVVLPIRIATVLAGLVLAPSEVLADLGTGSRGRRNAIVQVGSSHELALAPLRLKGPRTAFGGKRQWPVWTVRLTSSGARVYDDPGMPAVAELSLAQWSLVQACPRRRRRAVGPTASGASWRGRLRRVGARGVEEFTVEGEWLSLAWLGHLAGWEDPSRNFAS